MTLFKLKSAPIILIEDDNNTNIIPLVKELIYNEKYVINLFSYEQPIIYWKNVFKDKPNFTCYEDFSIDLVNNCLQEKCSIIIDSLNQMAICLGWNECLKYLRRIYRDPNVLQLIIILHKDCLVSSSRLQLQFNHIASAVVSYDSTNPQKITTTVKRSGKVVKSEEVLLYDYKTQILRCSPVVTEVPKEMEPEKPSPGTLSTFKIEVEQTDKLEKYKLKLPYMSKINEGESKVYYEPDAVDDWDEEDPDEDLDI